MLKLLRNITFGTLKSAHSAAAACYLQQTRNTFILKRKYEIKLYKKEGQPRKFRKSDHVYDFVENTDVRPDKMIDVILTEYVEGVGLPGEMVNVKRHFARNYLLAPQLAVYASPENIIKYKRKDDELIRTKYSSMYSTKTVKCLQHFVLLVVMHMDSQWTIEPWHIRSSARQSGIILTDESITLPDKPVSGPDLEFEGKVFLAKIKINNLEEALLRCRLTHWTTDISKLPVPPADDSPLLPVFPEDEALLATLPAPMDPKEKWGRY